MRNLSQRPEMGVCACGAKIEPKEIAGKWFTFERCQVCSGKLKAEQVKKSLRQLRIKKAARMRQTLSKVVPKLFADAHLRDLNKAFRIAIFGYDVKIGLVLYGPVGRGKSYALSAMARHLILKGKSVRRITYEMLCLQIRDTYQQGNDKTELDVIRPLIDCDYLIIEDVGSTTSIGKNESDFSLRTFYVLLDSRLEACKPTFISTNKSRKNLTASFDERIASRLSLFLWVGAGGEDKRCVK